MTDYTQEQARHLGQLEASVISAHAYIQCCDLANLARARAELEKAVSAIHARDRKIAVRLAELANGY